MDLIIGNSQMLHVGYPPWVFYSIAAVSVLLIAVRPFWGFLFAVFCLCGRDFHAAVFTRTSFLGPYLNLNDLLLWTALLAAVIDRLRQGLRIHAPRILLLVFALVLFGSVQSVYQYGPIAVVLRRCWAALIFPLMFFAATNAVGDEKRAAGFFWAVFLGAVLAAISHVSYVFLHTSSASQGIAQVRTISYLASGGDALLASSILLPMRLGARPKALLFYASLAVVALSLLLSLTRGLWVSVFIAIAAIPLFLRGSMLRVRAVIPLAATTVGLLLIGSSLFSIGELSEATSDRLESFTSRDTFASAYESRAQGADSELDLWYTTTPLVIGAGVALSLEVAGEDMDTADVTGALGHVAYSTYLAHFGLIGLIVYLVLLNYQTIRRGIGAFAAHGGPHADRVALLGVACAVINVASFLTSAHFLSSTTHVQGLLYGAVWSLWQAMSGRASGARPALSPLAKGATA